MYFNKISSGTILALLALSGMLFLVPLAVPAHAAQNAAQPTLSPSVTSYISGAAATGLTLTVTNPISNAYAITRITIFSPTDFPFASAATCGALLNVVTSTSPAAAVCSGSIAPGFSDTLTLGTVSTGLASPVASPPPTESFTTTVIDAGSNPASYTGPTWAVYDLAVGTTTTVTGAAAFTAGGSPETITVNDGTTQPGVPYTFTITNGAYPHAGYTASVAPKGVLTAATGKATTTFTPSNWATDTTTITATSGGGAGALTGASGAILTSAGTPTTVGWFYNAGANAFGVGKTFYLTGVPYFGISGVAGATRSGEFPAAAGSGPFEVTVSDSFQNSIAYGAITAPAITISASSGTGFDNGGASLVTTLTCLAPVANAVSCVTGQIAALNYYQGYPYGTVGQMTAIITGQYPGATPFSVTAASGNIVTGTDAASYALTLSSGVPGAGSAIKITATPNVGTQTGVPITFNLCGQQTGRTVCGGTTIGYAGSFVGGAQIGFASTTSGLTGTDVVSYTVDPTLGNTGTWNATAAAPTTANAKATYAIPASATAVTQPGSATSFKTLVYYSDQSTVDTKGAVVSGQTYYVVVELVDAYGNLATNPGPSQVQIQLSATGGATFSATTVYIASGGSATNGGGSFGPIQLVVPASVAVGTPIVLTASGVVSGLPVSPTTALTDVSALPSFNVKTPVPTSGTVYSSSTGVTFGGWANASAGYNPTTTSIASVNYKIGSGHWMQASGAGPNKDNYLVSLFMPVGLSTIQFNATDTTAAKNTVVSSVYNVLVDIAPPTFTFGSATSNTGCVTVTAATAEGDFNPATFTATWGGVAVAAGQIAWSGAQTAGTAGSLTATICGLTSQTATISVTGSTWAGLSSTNSESLTVTVPFADSITFNTGTATYGLVGAFKGVTVSVTNGWNTAQTIVVYATLKSGTSTYVATGTVTLAAGGTASVFVVDLQTVPAGSYTVTFAAVTTSNQAVSAPTTPISVVAT